MELPFKFEGPKLTHLHILQLLLPIFPGMVVVIGFALTHSSVAHHLWDIDLGYKVKVALAIATIYTIGLATSSIISVINSVVMRLIRRPRSGTPWANSYWRRIATEYLGSSLSPDTASFSSAEDLDRLNKFIAGLTNKEVQQLGIAKRREALQVIEKSLAQLAGTITGATAQEAQKPELGVLLSKARKVAAEQTSSLKAQKDVIEEVERQLRDLGIEYEWHSLYHALLFMQFPNLADPYGAFSLLMESLQAAGIAALWLMIQSGLWSPTGLFFVISLVLTTGFVRWLAFLMNGYYRIFASSQLAGMIQDIRQRDKPQERDKGGTP
jgi:hypothetical protein